MKKSYFHHIYFFPFLGLGLHLYLEFFLERQNLFLQGVICHCNPKITN
uniref:Uncharacterized protein n=1 Tax=Anguilla anguilla TaxID=7936 RepID=A0A0E9SBJ7_ANGAN